MAIKAVRRDNGDEIRFANATRAEEYFQAWPDAAEEWELVEVSAPPAPEPSVADRP